MPPAPKCRLSRRSRHFPTRPSVQIQPDESGQAFILNIVATDRLGLLYAISKVLAKYGVNLQTAKLATLGERAEDVFLIDGDALHAAPTGSGVNRSPPAQVELRQSISALAK